ncbi:MAG: universal stress protein [Myxococcota bacterium]
MSTILVPVDFSDCAPLLLDEAVRFARAFDAELLLFHACEVPPRLPRGAQLQPRGVERPVTVEEWLRQDARAHLAALQDVLRAKGAPHRTRVELGPVPDVILQVAAEERARMIVMGTHGRKGMTRVVLGSIAEEVVRRAEVPVVTVRTQHRPGCAAASCATCDSGRTAVERALEDEAEG